MIERRLFTAAKDTSPEAGLATVNHRLRVVTRLEYAHREANVPYFSGPGGITGPGGVAAKDPSTFTPDLRKRDDRILFNVTLRL